MEESEKRLWRRYARTRRQPAKDALRNELIELYLPLAERLARRKAARLPDHIDFDDLYSAAYEALLHSVPRFDLSRGIEPRTFFAHRIQGALTDYLRAIDPLSRTMRQRQIRIERWTQTEIDHPPTDDETFDRFGFRLHCPPVLSINQTVEHSDGRNTCIGDLLVDRRTPAVGSGVSNASEILRGCSKRERLLLLLYHVEGQTMSEIGDSLGISESRVSQMMKSLQRRLQLAA